MEQSANAYNLLEVLSTVGHILLSDLDRVLMCMTCKDANRMLKPGMSEQSPHAHDLSTSSSLAQWALLHEIAEPSELWLGACERGDVSALDWIPSVCSDIMVDDQLWKLAIQANNVVMLDHLWANQTKYPPKQTPTDLDVDSFDLYTTCAIQADSIAAFEWLCAKEYIVDEHSALQFAAGRFQKKTFDFLVGKQYPMNDFTVYAAIRFGNVALLRRLLAPANELDGFERYDPLEILQCVLEGSKFWGCNEQTVENFVIEVYNMGFEITLRAIDYSLGPRSVYSPHWTDDAAMCVRIGFLRGLTKTIEVREVCADSVEWYTDMKELVTQTWLVDEDALRPHPPDFWAAACDLLVCLAPTTPHTNTRVA